MNVAAAERRSKDDENERVVDQGAQAPPILVLGKAANA